MIENQHENVKIIEKQLELLELIKIKIKVLKQRFENLKKVFHEKIMKFHEEKNN